MKTLRYLLAAIVLLLLLLLIVIVAVAGDTLLSLWARLEQAPLYVSLLFAAVLAVFAVSGILVLWKLLRPSPTAARSAEAPNEDTLLARLSAAEAAGLDIATVRAELRELKGRRESGHLYIALYGSISTGKSSLVRALLPGASPLTGVNGGTTRQLERHHWTTSGGDEVVLIDMPGLHDPDRPMEQVLRDEALRAHIVVYLCDGDLTRPQQAELEELARLDKPLILALNKRDWYSAEEREQVLARLRERTRQIGDIDIVAISTRDTAEVVVQRPDGSERLETRPVQPAITPLARALQHRIDHDPQRLESLRDAAVFSVAARALDEVELADRIKRGEQIVRTHTRGAVVGALAAISPGSDILIQGALGISLVKSICSLHDIPVSQLEIERLLKLAQTRINRHLTLILAVAGNALKAFPGIGTVAGGLLHAVTYGMIFDALGNSLNQVLAQRGELASLPVINRFTETLGDQLERRSGEMVRLVLDARRDQRKP